MYITRVEIENIRSIRHLEWDLKDADAVAPGWYVILGDNGSGKTTFLRSVALNKGGFPREPFFIYAYPPTPLSYQKCKVFTSSEGNSSKSGVTKFTFYISQVQHFFDPIETDYPHFDEQFLFFSFGAFRRFDGENERTKDLAKSQPALSRHITLLDRSVGLPLGTEWLRQLRYLAVDPATKSVEANDTLEKVIVFINQSDLLLNGVKITSVDVNGVHLKDANGFHVGASDMSDGYSSVLSLTFELLRQLSIAYRADIFETHDNGKVTVKVPGVVQIDEVDAHLHPTWQKNIGFWFRKHFPQMQFIVTTHSPLVCQAAERGSIFLLPRPGTDETGRMLKGAERDRLLYGDITDAYSTQAFGGGDTRSPKGQEMLDRLGELNVKEMLLGLSEAEQEEQERLRLAMPSSATETP